MARNRKRANRRPARPQDSTGAQPADADARANGLTGQDDAEEQFEQAEEQFEELEDRLDEIEEKFEAGETVEIPDPEPDPEPVAAEPPATAAEAEPVAAASKPSSAPLPARTRESATAVEAHQVSTYARLTNFLQGSWRELQRVQWPDRRQVMQATGVVVGFVIVAGAFLGVADYLATKLINFILK